MRADDTGVVWPADTVFVPYRDPVDLMVLARQLDAAGHIFVASPNHRQVAMSAAAARFIGVTL